MFKKITNFSISFLCLRVYILCITKAAFSSWNCSDVQAIMYAYYMKLAAYVANDISLFHISIYYLWLSGADLVDWLHLQ